MTHAMEPRCGWRFMNAEQTGIVHEWQSGETPRCTGKAYALRMAGQWRVSFWDDADVRRSSYNNAPTDTAEEAMIQAERVIFSDWPMALKATGRSHG